MNRALLGLLWPLHTGFNVVRRLRDESHVHRDSAERFGGEEAAEARANNRDAGAAVLAMLVHGANDLPSR